EVGEYVTVTGTVTGATAVAVSAPGGGSTSAAVGGTFTASVRVGLKHAAIVVEAMNAAGSGRAAVHVFRPDGPDLLPEDEPDHVQALQAQQQAQAAPPPASKPAAIVPHSYDELVTRLSRPSGGAVAIPGDAVFKLPPPQH